MVMEHRVATITTQAKANRYLAELIPTEGFRNALKRVKQKSDAAISKELERLEQYVEGDSTIEAPAFFSLYGEFMKRLPDRTQAGPGVTMLNLSMREARRFADSIRVGVPSDLYYSATLLAVASLISIIWILSIAPSFSEMFALFDAQLPRFTQSLLNAPWLLFSVIAILAIALVSLMIGARRIAASIEVMAPLTPAWVRLVCGNRVMRAHENWRISTLANAWANAGREPVQALREAIDTMSASDSGLRQLTSEVHLADELGLAKHELGHQCERSLTAYRAAMESRRALTSRVMQVAIAILVGSVVIAIYLPIFKMGSVI